MSEPQPDQDAETREAEAREIRLLCWQSLPAEWLVAQVAGGLDEVERLERERAEKAQKLWTDQELPFQLVSHAWRHFRSHFQEGDQLWRWSNGQAAWDRLAGRAGLAIVRDGRVVISFLLAMN